MRKAGVKWRKILDFFCLFFFSVGLALLPQISYNKSCGKIIQKGVNDG